MMVLRRKAGDVICIGDDVRIVIQEVHAGQGVRIAIDAPVDVPVHRLEIYRLIQQENQAACHANALQWLQGGMHVADIDNGG